MVSFIRDGIICNLKRDPADLIISCISGFMDEFMGGIMGRQPGLFSSSSSRDCMLQAGRRDRRDRYSLRSLCSVCAGAADLSDVVEDRKLLECRPKGLRR